MEIASHTALCNGVLRMSVPQKLREVLIGYELFIVIIVVIIRSSQIVAIMASLIVFRFPPMVFSDFS